jgi:hypothetical protein
MANAEEIILLEHARSHKIKNYTVRVTCPRATLLSQYLVQLQTFNLRPSITSINKDSPHKTNPAHEANPGTRGHAKPLTALMADCYHCEMFHGEILPSRRCLLADL